MQSFDLARQMELAHYLPRNSPLHRLHPGAKLLLILFGITLLVAARGVATLIAALLVVCILITVARVPVALPFRGLLRALPWLVVVIVIQVLTDRYGDWGFVYGDFWFVHLRGGQVYLAIQSMLRFSDLILFLVLAITFTDAGELSYGTEALLGPFSSIGVPVRGLALVVTIALYFLPLFATEADRIVKSQTSRGADFSAKGSGLLARIRVYAPLFVPLIVLSLRHAENLARAMDARGYVAGSSRTRLIVHRLRAGSVAVSVFAAGLLAASIVNPLAGIDHALRGLFI